MGQALPQKVNGNRLSACICTHRAHRWFGPLDGNTKLTPEDFDAVMGHSTAVTDAAGSVFAAELIEAYPDAKVVLNYRKDLDAWHRSASKTLANVKHNRVLWILSFLSRQGFWAWHVYLDFMWSGIFRALDNDIETGVARNGKWVYKGRWIWHSVVSDVTS